MAELDLGRVVGRDGQDGQGVPPGGTAGQVLKKRSATNYDAEWGNEDLGLTGAAVGDLVRVNAVDANGRPTSWEAVSVDDVLEETVIIVNFASFSSLPQTKNSAKITADHVVLASTVGTPSAQTGDWTVTTADGSVTVSGSISGSTTLQLILGKAGTTV